MSAQTHGNPDSREVVLAARNVAKSYGQVHALKGVNFDIHRGQVTTLFGENGAGSLQGQVADLMTRKLVTCVTGDDALSVLDRMTQGRFRHMPVVDDEGGMIGLISIGDVVSARLKELNAEKEALTGMIMGA